MLHPVEGEIFYVDKPLTWTSFDVVKRVRGELSRRTKIKKLKVGHAGTLDPLATGVMVIVTGRATKRIEELQAHVKEYRQYALAPQPQASTLRQKSTPNTRGSISTARL